MFELRQLYCFADPVFFEDVSRWTTGRGFLAAAELEVSRRPVPDGWALRKRGVWTSLTPIGGELPEQGWKIHVSATPQNADRVVTAVWDHCVANGVRFKYLGNRNLVYALNAKYAPRESSGKTVTVYPADEAQLRVLLDDLSELLRGERGPRVLSDLQYGDSPLSVRYGAFVRRYCQNEHGERVLALRRPDGVLVPDRRRPVFRTPEWVELPGFLEPHLERLRAGASDDQPYRVERTLHFSNAGGVYRARRVTDGAQVVLKEARAGAGVDENQHDSVARLMREKHALEKLAGLPGVPEVLDHFSVGDHHFLVQEHVAGQPLHVWRGCNHPWVVSAEASGEQFTAYTERVLALLGRIELLLGEIHDRGIVFGDLHLGNILVGDDDSVSFIDFELAFDITETGHRPGLGATGFTSKHRTGVGVDEYALAAVKLGVFLVLNRVMALDPAKVHDFVRTVAEHFPVSQAFVDDLLRELTPPEGVHGPASLGLPLDVRFDTDDVRTAGKSVVEAILLSASPARTDRLFPGDLAQFAEGGGACLAHGAAGVLWALHASGMGGRHAEHEDWLLRAAASEPNLKPGFYDGAAGIAHVLDLFGHRDEARDLLLRHDDVLDAGLGMSLHSGLAGIALHRLHLAGAHGERDDLVRAVEIGGRIGEAITSGDHTSLWRRDLGPSRRPVEAGLMHGWSGAALLMVRLYERTGDRSWLDLAVRAVHRDLDRCVTTADGSLQVEETGVRTLPYLENGSAGIALVIGELLPHVTDDRLTAAFPALTLALSRGFVIQSDLYHGRAGLLAVLARLSRRTGLPDATAVLERHVHRLDWHAVSYRGRAAFPGTLDFRLSMDLATGSAGVLLAIATADRPDLGFLPFLSSSATG
ncbi:class III lanthionine synthetase LanKC [Lentzea sp. NPDC055074]